ncbi:MAG: FKBP-type peptidyl-prolyl cis-trans isomerase [Hyphomonadaceae bacterium]
MNLRRSAFLMGALALGACAARVLTPAEQAAASSAFLARNARAAGVRTTASGLQYRVLRTGALEAARPTALDVVIVHYEGRFPPPGRRVFDSSYARNAPEEFPLGRVIAGWTEGLQLMRVGEIYEFFIPPDLAYGAEGAGADVPPNAALIFRVELLGLKRPDGSQVWAR